MSKPIRRPRASWCASLLAFLVPVLTTSCAGLGAEFEDTRQLSDEAVVLGVPLLYQDDLYECGLATVSALCQFHDRELPAAEHERLTEIAGREGGLSGAELREVLEALDFEVYVFRGRLDDSAASPFHHVDRGRPVLVMVSDDGESHHSASSRATTP